MVTCQRIGEDFLNPNRNQHIYNIGELGSIWKVLLNRLLY